VIRKKTNYHVAALFLPEGVGSNGTESDLFTMSKYPALERYRIQQSQTLLFIARRTCLEKDGGARRDRTDDILLAKQALSQLSYGPKPGKMVGPGGLEPPTSRLSGVRSNHLSYGPPGIRLDWTIKSSISINEIGVNSGLAGVQDSVCKTSSVRLNQLRHATCVKKEKRRRRSSAFLIGFD
jgi:hypothetical protein